MPVSLPSQSFIPSNSLPGWLQALEESSGHFLLHFSAPGVPSLSCWVCSGVCISLALIGHIFGAAFGRECFRNLADGLVLK